MSSRSIDDEPEVHNVSSEHGSPAALHPTLPTITSSPSLISFIKIEVIVVLAAIATSSRNITQQQLLQDKICLQKFFASSHYCRDLNAQPDSLFKDKILSDYAMYHTFKEVLVMIPNILTCLYIGSWCDNRVNGRRICMILTSAALVFEIAMLLMNAAFFKLSYMILIASYFPASLIGLNFGFYLSLYSFVAASIPAESRAFRLVIINVVQSAATAIGTFTGGLVLATEPLFFHHQLRNYAGVFLMSLTSAGIMLLLVICSIRDEEQRETLDQNHNIESKSLLDKSGRQVKNKTSSYSSLFSLSNIQDILAILLKRREGTARQQLILLVISPLPFFLAIFGTASVTFSIIQKLYQWDYADYSNVSTIGAVIHPIVTLVFMPLMFRIVKVNDIQLSIIGTLSTFLGYLFLGTFAQVSPIAFFISLFLGSFSGVIGHGIRASISRLIPGNEVSRMFSLIAMLEALLPFTGSLIFSLILQSTISFYPALVFQLAAFCMVIGLCFLVYVDAIRSDARSEEAKE